MTTNVPKGAGRATATAKRNKHAQRTPLPPRAGSPGAEAIEERRVLSALSLVHAEVIELKGKPYGEMTVAELRKVAQALMVSGYKSLRRGDLLNAILEAERAVSKTADRLLGRDTVAEVFATVEKSKPTTRAHGKAPEVDEAICSRPAPNPKSAGKLEAFVEAAARLGWAEMTRSAPNQETYGVIVGRGEERITISWRDGVFVGEECYHSHPGRSPRKVINASAAKKIMAIPPAQADEEARKVTAHKSVRPRRDRGATATTAGRKALPFDPETADDEEVIRAVSGRNISWTNEISGAVEDAYVKGSVDEISIQAGKSGRSIRFTSMTGFRSVRVSSIIAIR